MSLKLPHVVTLKYLSFHSVCRVAASKSGLEAEMAQRRRLFEHKASLQKDGIEKCIREKQQDRHKLEQQQELLQQTFNQQILYLEERYIFAIWS